MRGGKPNHGHKTRPELLTGVLGLSTRLRADCKGSSPLPGRLPLHPAVPQGRRAAHLCYCQNLASYAILGMNRCERMGVQYRFSG